MSMEGVANATRAMRAKGAPSAVQKQIDSTFTKEELDRLGSAIELVKDAAITEFITGQSGPGMTVAGLANRFRSNPQQFAIEMLTRTAGGYGGASAQNVSDPTYFRNAVTQAIDFAKRQGLSQESIISTANSAYSKVYAQNVPEPNSSFGDFVKTAVAMIAPVVIPGIGAEIGAALLPTVSAGTQAVIGSAIAGGTVAEITGGKFVEGALTSAAIAAGSAQTAQAASDATIGSTSVNANYSIPSPTAPVIDGMGGQGLSTAASGLGITAPSSGVIGDPTSFINQVAPIVVTPPALNTNLTMPTSPVLEDMGAQGIKAPETTGTNIAGTASGEPGLVASTVPGVEAMGGAQGITVDVPGGTLGQTGVTPGAATSVNQAESATGPTASEIAQKSVEQGLANTAAGLIVEKQSFQAYVDAEQLDQRLWEEEQARLDAEAAARNQIDTDSFSKAQADLDAMFQQERDEIARQAAEYAAAQQRVQELADAERARAEAEQAALAEQRARTEAEAAAAAERNRRDIEGMQREGAEREVARRRATRSTVSRPLLAGLGDAKGPQPLGYGSQIGRGGASMGGASTLGVG